MSVKKTKKETGSPAIAKSDDGTIQITYTIPFDKVRSARKVVVDEYAKDTEVPGFRKGNAPEAKVMEQIPDHTLIEQTLGQILPKLFAETIKEEKLRPAIYPKFELIKAVEGEDWQVRATTCEIPDLMLGDYKQKILGSARAKSIWTPEKGDKKKELTNDQKQQMAIEALAESIKVEIPKILIEEEINSRLSRLLERIEKLGLTLENYLASLGKTAEQLRTDYEKQAKEALILDIALSQIAEKEGIKISDEEVTKAIEASAGEPKLAENLNTPEQKNLVRAVLTKRAALEKLTSFF